MTCLPADTRTYDLEPAGCRTDPVRNIRSCVCYDYDYCNHSVIVNSKNNLLPFIILSFIIHNLL